MCTANMHVLMHVHVGSTEIRPPRIACLHCIRHEQRPRAQPRWPLPMSALRTLAATVAVCSLQHTPVSYSLFCCVSAFRAGARPLQLSPCNTPATSRRPWWRRGHTAHACPPWDSVGAPARVPASTRYAAYRACMLRCEWHYVQTARLPIWVDMDSTMTSARIVPALPSLRMPPSPLSTLHSSSRRHSREHHMSAHEPAAGCCYLDASLPSPRISSMPLLHTQAARCTATTLISRHPRTSTLNTRLLNQHGCPVLKRCPPTLRARSCGGTTHGSCRYKKCAPQSHGGVGLAHACPYG